MKFNKKLAVAVSGAVLLMAGQYALADSTTDIVDALVSKGVLTEEEGKLISKGHTSQKEKTPVIKEKDGAFSLESASGRNSIQLTGRMHFDYRNVNNPGLTDGSIRSISDKDTASSADQYELRRARIGIKGKLAKVFNYEAVTNLVGGTPTVDVAYLDFAKYDQVQFRFGKFKQPFNLEELTSSNNMDFLERSYVNQNAPAKKLGAQVMGEAIPGVTYAVSAFQFNDTELNYQSEDMSYAARGTVNIAELIGNKDMIIHAGLSGYDGSYAVRPASSSQDAGSTTTTGTFMAYRSGGRGLSNIFRAQIQGTALSNPTNSGLSDSTSFVETRVGGLEGILAYGPVKIQGEYSIGDYTATAQDKARSTLDTDNYYAEVMWLVTGEKYSDFYKKGIFGAIKPKQEFDLDKFSGLGAWELGLRYEAYNVWDGTMTSLGGATGGTRMQGNLNCSGVDSGATSGNSSQTAASANKYGCSSGAQTLTAGIKWILNPNLLVKAAYTHTRFDHSWWHYDVNQGSGAPMKYEDTLSVRGQFMF